MKKNLKLLALLFVLFFASCKKNMNQQQTPPPGGSELPGGLNAKDLQIVLPANTQG